MKPELIKLACRDRGFVPIALADLKFENHADPTKPVTFEGYGSVWNSVDSYGDTMVKGAFTDALQKRMPMMFMGHNTRVVPGKWVAASEDDKGLKLTGELTPGHSVAADLGASLKHGAMNGLSVGGYTERQEPGPADTRRVLKFDLWEVSPVTLPAEQLARIDTTSVKALIDTCASIRDFETCLREEVGFSKSAATDFVSRLVKVARGEPVGKKEAEEISRLAAKILDKSHDLPTWS